MDRKKLKVAVCYYGIASNIGVHDANVHNQPVNYLSCYPSHQRNIWLPNDADIFIHSWSTQVKDDLIDKYSPVDYIVEQQIDFTQQANEVNNNPSDRFYKMRHHIMSRWYSTKKVLELKSMYEDSNNFKYDVVMLTRFDCVYNSVWNFNEVDLNYWYVIGGWPLSYQEGLPDLWFFSNSKTMDVFGLVYDEMRESFYDRRYDIRNNEWDAHMLIRRHLARHGLIKDMKFYKLHYIDSDIRRG